MDKLEDNSQGFANDVNKFVKDQKKAAVKGCEFCVIFCPKIDCIIVLMPPRHLQQAWFLVYLPRPLTAHR